MSTVKCVSDRMMIFHWLVCVYVEVLMNVWCFFFILLVLAIFNTRQSITMSKYVYGPVQKKNQHKKIDFCLLNRTGFFCVSSYHMRGIDIDAILQCSNTFTKSHEKNSEKKKKKAEKGRKIAEKVKVFRVNQRGQLMHFRRFVYTKMTLIITWSLCAQICDGLILGETKTTKITTKFSHLWTIRP